MILAYWELFTPDNMEHAGRILVATGWILVKVGGLILILV